MCCTDSWGLHCVREILAARGWLRSRMIRGLSLWVRGEINRIVRKSNPTATMWNWNQQKADTAQVRTSSQKTTPPHPSASFCFRKEWHQNLLESLKYSHHAQGTRLRGGGICSRSCVINPLLWVLMQYAEGYTKL